jgi:hypothetical protein
MTFYPELQVRRTWMIATDVATFVWVVIWIKVADSVHDAVRQLAAPGAGLENAGRSLAGSLGDAAGASDGIPFVGGRLADPLKAAQRAGKSLADAGAAEQTASHRLALILALAIAMLALMPVLFIWAPLRIRWILAATAAAQLRTAAGANAVTVLAVRGAARRPLARLAAARLPGEPFAVADREAVEALAAMELRALGLRPRRE